VAGLDVERLCRAIELTRFPVPEDRDHAETESEAGLVRAADLIGQLADPAYPRKLAALFCEFRETGVAERLGYRDPADLAERYRGTVTAEEILETPFLFVGTIEEMAEQIIRNRDRYGFTYYTVHEPYLDAFAPVINRIRALGM